MTCDCCGTQLNVFRTDNEYIYYRCKKCNFWTFRMIDGSLPVCEYFEYATFDSEAATKWDDLTQEAERILLYKIKSIYPNETSIRTFLDVGCSEGIYVNAANNLGMIAVGFEIDKAKVNRAKERGLNIFYPDYSKIEQNSIDFILMRHTIEHIPNFADVLLSLAKLLKPDGILCIECPNQAGIPALFMRNKKKGMRFARHLCPPGHMNAFEEKSFRFISARIGLKFNKSITYSPDNPNWSFTSYYNSGKLKAVIHQVCSMIGAGDNLAVFLSK